MSSDRLLLDTVFVQALLNVRDQYHQQALTIRGRVRAAQEIWVTSAVLTEVADGLHAQTEWALLTLYSSATKQPTFMLFS